MMRHNPSRSGLAIVTAAAAMIVIMALAVALTDVTVSSVRTGVDRQAEAGLVISSESIANIGFNHLQNLQTLASELQTAKARSASDAAADLTSAVIAAAPLSHGSPTVACSDLKVTWKWLGSMSVPILGAAQNQDIYQITATAAIGGPARYFNSDGSTNRVGDINRYRRRRVEAVFTQFPSNVYRQAMFARNGYDFMGSANTDSWQSNGGTTAYQSAPKGSKGDLSSNGTITVQKPTAVQGTVRSNINMPVPPMNCTAPSGAIPLPGPGIDTFSKTSGPMTSGVYHCSAIDVDSIQFAPGAQIDIYVDGPLLITDDFVVPSTTTVRIFQSNYDPALGTTTINGNITVGCPQNPRALQVYSLYDGTLGGNQANPVAVDLKMNGTAQLGAVFFCPYATMKLNGTFDWYGSIVANSFFDPTSSGKVNGNFAFHYDESLANLELPFPPTLVVVGWRAETLGFNRFKPNGEAWDAP
jgi:hypothetical protein